MTVFMTVFIKIFNAVVITNIMMDRRIVTSIGIIIIIISSIFIIIIISIRTSISTSHISTSHISTGNSIGIHPSSGATAVTEGVIAEVDGFQCAVICQHIKQSEHGVWVSVG